MVCVNCGKSLIRGYAFCMECGSPVPPEVLEEGGMPGRTDDEGRPKPETEGGAEKSENDGGDNGGQTENSVTEVRSSMPGIEPLDSGSSETLVFCPNCGMHMQSEPYRCSKCGMKLVERPNVPMSAGGVPLMNVDAAGGIGGGLDGISDSDIEQISSFMSGSGNIPIFAAEDNSTPDLFGSDISANDFAALNEQLASFSASNEMPGIEAIDAPKHESKTETAKRPVERRVDDFNMGGGFDAALSDNAVPVIGNYSMDEIPEENVDLDPYKFLNASMEDALEPPPSMPRSAAPVKAAEIPEPTVPAAVPGNVQPVPAAPSAPKSPEPPAFPETAPVIEEAAPVIGEFVPEQPAAPKAPETAEDVFGQPVPPMPRQSSEQTGNNSAARGNLFRCRFCGQSMYDTDKFCPSCGASYKSGSPKPKEKSKAPIVILFAALLALAAGAGIYFAMTILNNGNGGEQLPSNTNSAPVSEPSETESVPETSGISEPESSDESTSSSAPPVSTPGSAAGAPSSSSTPQSSTGTAPGSSSTPFGPASTPSGSSTGMPPSSTGAPNSSTSRSSSTGGPPSSFSTPYGPM